MANALPSLLQGVQYAGHVLASNKMSSGASVM